MTCKRDRDGESKSSPIQFRPGAFCGPPRHTGGDLLDGGIRSPRGLAVHEPRGVSGAEQHGVGECRARRLARNPRDARPLQLRRCPVEATAPAIQLARIPRAPFHRQHSGEHMEAAWMRGAALVMAPHGHQPQTRCSDTAPASPRMCSPAARVWR